MLVFVICATYIIPGLAVSLVRAEPPIKESALPSISHSWDRNLPSASRFTILSDFNNEAVRDNNTGLVWELSPNSIDRLWGNAIGYCLNKAVGGQKGWRLPSAPELATLIDPTVPLPALPQGHPFTNLQSDYEYWSATTNGEDAAFAWLVAFNSVNGIVGTQTKINANKAWCVRGPMQESVY